LLLFTIIGGTITRVLADEAKEWLAWLPPKLIRWASARLTDDRERLEEEWLAHANDLPGNLAKCWHAFGCVVASARLSNHISQALLRGFAVGVAETALIVEIARLMVRRLAWELGGPQSSRDPDVVIWERVRQKNGGMCVLALAGMRFIVVDVCEELIEEINQYEAELARRRENPSRFDRFNEAVDHLVDCELDRVAKRYQRILIYFGSSFAPGSDSAV
jgi:hypothetical protein